jgi:hypothetical protein
LANKVANSAEDARAKRSNEEASCVGGEGRQQRGGVSAAVSLPGGKKSAAKKGVSVAYK